MSEARLEGLGEVSVVIPARNEASSIAAVVAGVAAYGPMEIIVVDDASTDDTGSLAADAGARVVRHPYAKGNGAAIKAGAREARGLLVAFMDADGQHCPDDLPRLVNAAREGFDLVVGTRDRTAHASVFRRIGNLIYNTLASWIVGQRILDLTSGFRVANADKFREFLQMLPNGFSYPTTSTMAFFRSGYNVRFEPVTVRQRSSTQKSHINLMRDGSRFLLIIFRIAALYSPLKVFFPTAVTFFAAGVGYYVYTFLADGRFTNFGMLLLTTAVLVFLIGLVSEQITTLMYLSTRDEHDQSAGP